MFKRNLNQMQAAIYIYSFKPIWKMTRCWVNWLRLNLLIFFYWMSYKRLLNFFLSCCAEIILWQSPYKRWFLTTRGSITHWKRVCGIAGILVKSGWIFPVLSDILSWLTKLQCIWFCRDLSISKNLISVIGFY